jgi:cytochrome c oxidase subunit 4
MSERVTPAITYYAVFAALIALTLLTVGISFLPLAKTGHTVAGLCIAFGKAMLVALFFMHLLHSPRLTWLAFSAGLFWLVIQLGLTLTDYLSRTWG